MAPLLLERDIIIKINRRLAVLAWLRLRLLAWLALLWCLLPAALAKDQVCESASLERVVNLALVLSRLNAQRFARNGDYLADLESLLIPAV